MGTIGNILVDWLSLALNIVVEVIHLRGHSGSGLVDIPWQMGHPPQLFGFLTDAPFYTIMWSILYLTTPFLLNNQEV
jgi:hypothetical protein